MGNPIPQVPYIRSVGQFQTTAVLLRFQLQTGSRVALRALAPVAAGAVAASVMYGSPMAVILVFTGLLFPPTTSTAAAVLATVICLGVAVSSAPRLTSGLAGWIRHLPASGIASRRAAATGLVMVQLPVLVLIGAGGLAALADQVMTTWPRLAAVVPLAWATSLAALHVERTWTRAVAIVAALFVWRGTWTGLLAGVVLMTVADLLAGSAAAPSPRSARRRRTSISSPLSAAGSPGVAAVRLWWKLSRRALGRRTVLGLGSGVLALLPVFFFLRNNELTVTQQAIALRLAVITGVVFVMAATADGLVKRRPPWPWIRSLPWSAGTRVALDATLLVVLATPVFLVALIFHPGVVWVVAATLPILGLRGATAIREAPGRLSGASGQLVLEGMLVAILTALVPWAPLVFLALAPAAARHAAESERCQEISRWHELHHLAAGDPGSWSDA
jgi:hypothetical protein